MKKSGIQEQLLSLLLLRIEADYKEIIAEGVTIPTIIKWCAQRGFIQQALTLYSELIPDYLVKYRIIYPLDETAMREKYEKVGNQYQSWQNYFINGYVSKVDEKMKKREYINHIETRLNLLLHDAKGQLAYWKQGKEVQDSEIYIQNIIKKLALFDEPETIIYEKIQEKEIRHMIDKLHSQYIQALHKPYSISKQEYINQKLTKERVYNYIVSNSNNLGKLMKLDIHEFYNEWAVIATSGHKALFNKERKIDITIAMSNYYKTKDKRNHTNHAGMNVTSIQSVTDEAREIIEHMNLLLSLERDCSPKGQEVEGTLVSN